MQESTGRAWVGYVSYRPLSATYISPRDYFFTGLGLVFSLSRAPRVFPLRFVPDYLVKQACRMYTEIGEKLDARFFCARTDVIQPDWGWKNRLKKVKSARV